MKSWRQTLRDGFVSGSFASLVSTVVLSLCGKRETGAAAAPTNATSHWIWGEPAIRQNAPSTRFTLTGYAIHHASSCLWGTIYERWLGNSASIKALNNPFSSAAAIAALAAFVDLRVTPERLRPGFEQRLATPSLVLVYASFGLALGIRGIMARRRNSPR